MGGRQSRAPPGSVCHASRHPSSTTLTRCPRKRVSPCAGGRASVGMEGAVPSLHQPPRGPCRTPWLLWQMWMVSGAGHYGMSFHLRKAARLRSPPCAPESLRVRKGMAVMGRGRQWVHPNGTGSIPESHSASQHHRVNPSAHILPEAGRRAEGLARAGLQHTSSGCRDALLWQQLGGHGFPDVGYKHPIVFPELIAQRPPTLLAMGCADYGDVAGSSGNT